MDEKCDENSALWLNVGPQNWGSDPKYLDQFFLKPANPEAYKP